MVRLQIGFNRTLDGHKGRLGKGEGNGKKELSANRDMSESK